MIPSPISGPMSPTADHQARSSEASVAASSRNVGLRDTTAEAAVRSLPGVCGVVALRGSAVASNQPGVIYLLPDAAKAPSLSDVYRVSGNIGWHSPSIVFIDVIPADSCGGVDVSMLPQLDVSREEFGGVEEIAAKDAWETRAAEAWCDVLGEERVGRFDNFKNAPGYSLMAAQVAARLSQMLAFDVSVKHVHEAHAVWQLSNKLRARGAVQAQPDRPTETPVGDAKPKAGGLPSSPDPFPLSPWQERIWTAERLDGGVAYNIPVGWRLTGALDIEALAAALLELQRRHDALRLRIDVVGGEALQRVVPSHFEGELWRLDVRDTDARDVERYAAEEARTPFDLQRAGPLRARLLRISASEHVLLLTLHHVAADGWSVGVVADDLGKLYGRGMPAAPALSLHALVEEERRRSSPDAQSHEFWLRRMAPPAPELSLPFDRPPGADVKLGANSIALSIPESIASAVLTFARRRGCTPFAVIATVLQMFLARLSGQRDVVLGYPVARRDVVSREGMVCCLINTLGLRTQVSPHESFDVLLHRVQLQLLEGMEYPDTILERLPGRPAGSLFHAMLNFNEHDRPRLDIEGLQAQALPRHSTGSPYPLTWILSPTETGFTGRLEFDRDRFEVDTVRRLADHWLTLLSSSMATPERSVATLDWMTPAQRTAIIDIGSAPAQDPHPTLAHRTFEAHAKAAPDAVALICESGSFSYGELNARANAMAHRMLDAGATVGSHVAVCVGRGAMLACALLAVQKCGATYLPLDPGAPSARIMTMLHEARPLLLVTDSVGVRRLAGLHDARVIEVDYSDLGGTFEVDPTPSIPNEAAAYCLFTSGSSGAPKGVLVSFGALADHVSAAAHIYELTPKDLVLQFASCTFDTSIEQALVAWSSGSCVLMRDDEHWSADELLDRLRTHAVTVADIPLSYWQLLASRPEIAEGTTSLRLLIVGGEPVFAAHSLPGFAGIKALNAYGPTETTVTCTIGLLDDRAGCLGPYVSIGRPLPGTSIHILDERLQPLPIGVAGEIAIAGPRVALGYMMRPAQTAERFLPCPFGDPGSRMYRSGDIGRLLVDGRVEYLGRSDLQVKVRGVRIELGEIEAMLARHPAVRDVAATLAGPAGESFLAVAVVLQADTPDLAGLQAFARQNLSEALMPSAWLVVPALPLTTQGKVDRTALSSRIAAGAWARNRADEQPASPTLATLLALLKQLAPECVADPAMPLVDAGFHSVLLLRLCASCRDAFGVAPRLREVLKAGSAERIATLIDRLVAESASG